MYKNILIAIDDSDVSYLVIQEAINLAKNEGATLRFLFVTDENLAYFDGMPPAYNSLRISSKAEGEKILDAAEKLVRAAGVKFECYLAELNISEGSIADKIVEEANRWPADLIIVGTHKHSVWHHIFTGSVAEDVIDESSVPVLVIHSSEIKKKHKPLFAAV